MYFFKKKIKKIKKNQYDAKLFLHHNETNWSDSVVHSQGKK